MTTRSYRSILLVTAFLVMRSGGAHAQSQLGASDIGVKLSETNVLHVGVAAEAGYDSNVFYNDSRKTDSAVLRIVPSMLVTNNGRDGQAHSELVYSLGASMIYREYLKADSNVRQQRAFIPTASASLLIPGAKANFGISDQFTRNEEPPYVPGGNPIVRDTNQGSANLGISPGGGRLTTSFRYTNALDLFETTEFKGASSMTHDGMVDVGWKWLPKTALFLQVGGGYTHFLYTSAPGSAGRESSYPLRALGGIRGLLSPKTTVNLGAGYATAFYQDSKNPSGVANLHVLASVGYIPTLLSRMSLALFHGFRNSPVIGNYYNVDSATFALNYLIGHVVAGSSVTYEYRRYQNYVTVIPTAGMGPGTMQAVDRRDHIVSGGVSLDYYIQRWFYAGASYSIGLVDPTGPDPTAVKYTKQQVFARLGVSY
jgi:hypothetical protein